MYTYSQEISDTMEMEMISGLPSEWRYTEAQKTTTNGDSGDNSSSHGIPPPGNENTGVQQYSSTGKRPLTGKYPGAY